MTCKKYTFKYESPHLPFPYIVLQFAAYYRLYDLGYFNEDTDRRGPLTKLEEDIVDTAEVALDKFLDYVDPPGEKPS